MSTTANIAAKGLKGTGITQDVVDKLHLGQTIVFVGELQVDKHSENRAGDEAFTLTILDIEPATIALVEDHLRNMKRALHYERKLGEEGPQLRVPGDHDDPSVDDVLDHSKGILTERGGEPRLIDPDVEDPEDTEAGDDIDEPALDLDDEPVPVA